LKDHVTRERVTPRSWMDAIFTAVDKDQLGEDEAVPLSAAYTAASMDTTVLGLVETLVQLAQHPAQWDLLRTRPDLAPSALHESLRLEAPIQGFGRLAAQAANIGGIDLRLGARVRVLYGSAGRDHKQWGPTADTYDITRPHLTDHLAFGEGPHHCAGLHLAQRQTTAILTALARRHTHLALHEQPTRLIHNTLRGYAHATLTTT
ncbi:cytochrome P450, partial [Streptomyces sp. NPDC003860]